MDGLFGAPQRAARPLSATYSAPAYRSSKTERARYAAIKTVNPIPCDECFANQHEARGDCWPRAQAKTRRTIKNRPTLNLCSQHAELWRERDQEDAPGR